MNFPNPEINQIMSIDSNQKCVDCSAPNPQFTSLNNAVFLCDNCANAHRALGANISVVKSLTNDQFTQDEVNLLRLGGNFRFNALISEYGITSDQNKEFKYHLKIADYYRKLLVAELNKVNNPSEYEQLQNNKPSAEEGLQIMESVTAESINQAQQNQNQNQNQNQEQNELSKDASALYGKITGFFSSVGNALNNVVQQYGIDQKVHELKNSVNQGAKNFGENHPSIQNAASTAMDGIKTAGTYVAETANKIANSEPVKNIQQKVNETYQGVVNSETVKNLSKKAEESYISLKKKANETFGNNNAQQPNQEPNQQPNQEPNQQPNQEPNQQPNQEPNQQPNQESNQEVNQESNQQPENNNIQNQP